MGLFQAVAKSVQEVIYVNYLDLMHKEGSVKYRAVVFH